MIDIRGYAQELWEVWLCDPRNEEFRTLFDRVGPSGQAELVDHILAPFQLLKDIVHDEDNWNFQDAGVSIFTYVALLGSGFADAVIVFLLQVSMPVVLWFFYTSDRDDESIAVGTRAMLCAVLCYYLYKVVRGKIP